MPKKVAFYLSSMRKGGAERVIANLTEYFYHKNYQVLLVTTHVAEEEYPVPEGVCRRISEPAQEELGGGRLGNLKKRLRKLRSIWKEEKPDVIVSFIGKNNMMAILTAMGLGIPVAVSVRGEPSQEYYSPVLRFLARSLFHLADGVILQTRRCMDFFPKSIQKKAVILKNPVNPSFFKPRYEGEREKTITAVGRIDENKNHELLIRAFAQIAGQFPEYRLVIYGEGDKRQELCKLSEELGLKNRISLPGSIADVSEAIYKTSVFVLSSNTEGMPNTLIEAMIMGLPVIATDCPCGGPAELIRSGENGILTPVGDVNAMKDNLQYMLKNLQNAEKMGKQAKITGETYRPEPVLKEWEKYLISLGL